MQNFFHLPEGAYLLSHSVGCLPSKTQNALHIDYFTPWAKSGGDAWPSWLAIVDGFCEELALLLNGSAEDFCPQANLSSSLTKYLMSMPVDPNKNKVLMHQTAFPSMGFVVQALKTYGYDLVMIDQQYDSNELDSWQEAIKDDVAAILITHVHSNTGRLSQVGKIISLAKTCQAKVIVDIAQSAGIVPIDLSHWQVDMVMGSCVKWLCGGPGAGFMWLNPAEINALKPADVGWFSHQDPFEFDIQHFEYAKGAKRFWGGTPNIAAFSIARASIKVINTIGVDLIRQHSQYLQSLVLRAAAPYLTVPIELDLNGGTLCLSFSEKIANQLHTLLQQNKVFFDRRGDTLRLSFHIYNDESEADLIVRLFRHLES